MTCDKITLQIYYSTKLIFGFLSIGSSYHRWRPLHFTFCLWYRVSPSTHINARLKNNPNDFRCELQETTESLFFVVFLAFIYTLKIVRINWNNLSRYYTLQENSGSLTDIPTENEILGISRRIFEDIPRKHKIWFPRNFLGIYRRNSEEISIRRNILMEYRGKMYSSEKTDEFRGYIIAVREPLESRWGILKIPTN